MSRELRKAEMAVRKWAAQIHGLDFNLAVLPVGAEGVPKVVDRLSTANQNLLSAISTYNDIADG
jgi:hypothetical protein